jgi:hypothetical protein
MKISCAENLRHWLGDLTGADDTRVFAVDGGIGGAWEVVEVLEQEGHVVLHLGEFHHSLPRQTDQHGETR